MFHSHRSFHFFKTVPCTISLITASTMKFRGSHPSGVLAYWFLFIMVTMIIYHHLAIRPSSAAISVMGKHLDLANIVEMTLASRYSLDEVLDAVRFYQDNGEHFGNKEDFDFLSSLFKSFCNDNPTILVCGTNEGQSIEQIVAVCPQTSIHGFEIQGDVYSRATDTFKDNPNIKIHHNGLSDKRGKLHVTGRGEIAGLYSPEGRWEGAPERGSVEVITPAGFLEDQKMSGLFYALIDVEGHEQEVIKGMGLETNAAKFPVFQYELGGTWADSRRTGPWTQFTTALYLELNGYEVYLIGSKDGKATLLRTPPEFYRYSTVHYEGFENKGQKYFVQGNALAVHKQHASAKMKSFVEEAVRRAHEFQINQH